MSGIRFDIARAQATLAVLRAARAAIAEHLSALEASADALSGQWSGEAQRAYASAQAQWSATMTELTAVLDGTREVLQRFTDAIERLERELATGWPG